MGIPNKLSPVTGDGGILPNGYLAAEFLATTTATTQISTGIEQTRSIGVHARYLPIGGNPYAMVLTPWIDGGNQVRFPTSNTKFVWLAQTFNVYGSVITDAKGNFKESGLLEYNGQATTITSWDMPEPPREFKLCNKCTGQFYFATFTEGQKVIAHYIPALELTTGKAGLYDTVHKTFNILNAGVGLTIFQARQLGKLPVVESGTLTVSLPWEAQWDAGVQNALDIAAKKRWTITVQYRDPEIATTNIPISFLESTGEQYINTNVVPDSTIEFDMQIAYTAPLKETIGYKPYFGCIGRDSYGNFRLAHSSNVTESNDFEAFVMESFYWFRYTADAIEARKIYRLQTALTPLSGTTPAVSMDGAPMTFISRSAGSYQYTGPITTPIGLFGRIGFGEITSKGTPFIVKSAHLIKNGISAFNAVGVLDSTGTPCMHDRVTDQLVYNSGTGTFIAGFDTVAQARHIAHLPDVTAETDAAKKSLTVSLPWEAQLVSTGVPAAIEVAIGRGWTITVQYREAEVDNVYYNRYAACKTVNDMKAVNPDYKTDLTAAGEWLYELPSLTNCDYMFSDSKQITKFWPNSLPKLATTYFTFSSCPNLKTWHTRFPNNWSLDRCFYGSGLEVFDIDGEGIKATHLSLMCGQCKNLRVFNAVFTGKISTATQTFDACILDKESVLRISTAMPSKSGVTFTIGIHVDHENDTEVLAALATMEANGWAVVPQWNGIATTQTASTFGLRRKPVYAKVVEIDGEQYLDWGHYATNWEANGYQEFTSVEEAKEYFNINQPEEV